MADELRLTCWHTPDRLALKIQLQNLAGVFYNSEAELVQIDTGYSEELLIPQFIFDELNLTFWQRPDSVAGQGITVTGQVIHFIESTLDVVIPDAGIRQRVVAQTFPQNNRFLIGRAFLRRYKIILDGPGAQTCLLFSRA